MQIDYLKAALLAGWMLSVGALGYLSGTTSAVGWALVAVLSLVPPVFMVRLWSAPSPTMSETIQDVLR